MHIVAPRTERSPFNLFNSIFVCPYILCLFLYWDVKNRCFSQTCVKSIVGQCSLSADQKLSIGLKVLSCTGRCSNLGRIPVMATLGVSFSMRLISATHHRSFKYSSPLVSSLPPFPFVRFHFLPAPDCQNESRVPRRSPLHRTDSIPFASSMKSAPVK